MKKFATILLLLPAISGCSSSPSSGAVNINVTGVWVGTQKLSNGISIKSTYDLVDTNGKITGQVFPTDIPSAAKSSITGSQKNGIATLEIANDYTWKISGNFTEKTFSGNAQVYDGSQQIGTVTINLSK
jgi:hypothetical protein